MLDYDLRSLVAAATRLVEVTTDFVNDENKRRAKKDANGLGL